MRLRVTFLSTLLLLALLINGKPVQAQQSPGDPFGDSFFTPEMVLLHQQEISLSEDQKNNLKAEVRKAQARFTELQWQLQDEAEKMLAQIKQQRIDEQQALVVLDRILDIEREIKRLQVALAVRIKNSLSLEQQTRLQEIKNKTKGK